MVTFEQVNQCMQYDAVTGVLSWRLIKSRNCFVGSPAGSVVVDSSGKSYRQVKFQRKNFYAHNLIILIASGNWPVGVVDHIDGNGLNNTLSNLRVVTQVKNCQNMRRSKRNKSGVTGVFWLANDKRWKAYIGHAGKLVHLGRFKRKDEAIKARKAAEIEFDFHPNHGQDRPL